MKSPFNRFLAGTLSFLATILLLLGAGPYRTHSQTDESMERQRYSAGVRATYNFRFGKDNLSAPGNGAIEGNEFIQAGAFPEAEYCGHCHEEAYKQWRQSLHSNSFRTPFYRTSVNLLIQSKGIEFSRHCDSCHNPIALLSGGLTQESTVDRSFDKDGLTCTTCHSVQRLQSTSGNGSYVMGVPAVMVDENGERIPGKVPYSEIMEHPDRHAAAVIQSFYRTPEFCAACHKANLPNPLNEYKFIRAFTTYDEWQNSKFSNENPLTFYRAEFTTCQRCHMPLVPTTLRDYGEQQGMLASHRWLAGNTAVPFYYGFDDQLQKTIEFLKSGKFLNVDIFALKKAGEDNLIAPLGTVSFDVNPTERVEAYVVVQNKNIGHSLIPEVRDLYEGWVEFTVRDATGNDIYHSGFLKPDGLIDPRAHSFTNRPVNLSGEFVDNHKVWAIHSMAYDNSIQSGRSALVRYEFQIPRDVKGPLSISARVNYRHLRQSYLNNVFGTDHPLYPVVEIASRTLLLNIGRNAPVAPQSGDNEDWMRWNNLGIGFLDQQQYSDAVDAFQQVVKLRPDYEDGYVNVALTYIEWEKYSSARPFLEKALELHPSYARALYYLASVEQREGHPEAQVADLLRVVEMYPLARDPHRELGIAYYQQHRPDDAMLQFEQLQAIDPDDVAAHYNLAILYRRKGKKMEAAEQAALYATKRIDPAAPTYSLDFLRKHPEISTESIPWHRHTDLKMKMDGSPAPTGTGGTTGGQTN
ncbi:MAG: tetratricopeptide repeat protein [Candidatus Acidiferrum sp.]